MRRIIPITITACWAQESAEKKRRKSQTITVAFDWRAANHPTHTVWTCKSHKRKAAKGPTHSFVVSARVRRIIPITTCWAHISHKRNICVCLASVRRIIAITRVGRAHHTKKTIAITMAGRANNTKTKRDEGASSSLFLASVRRIIRITTFRAHRPDKRTTTTGPNHHIFGGLATNQPNHKVLGAQITRKERDERACNHR